MQKHLLVTRVEQMLNEKGIHYYKDRETDIYIQCDFLSLGKSDCEKTIRYEASVFFHEDERVIYFWDQIVELDTNATSGEYPAKRSLSSMVYRNVKLIRRDPTGQPIEVSMFLGEIPLLFIGTAKEHKWKYKTVVERENALYPPVVMPVHHAEARKISSAKQGEAVFVQTQTKHHRIGIIVNKARMMETISLLLTGIASHLAAHRSPYAPIWIIAALIFVVSHIACRVLFRKWVYVAIIGILLAGALMFELWNKGNSLSSFFLNKNVIFE